MKTLSTAEEINQRFANTLVSALGIEITAIHEQAVHGRMPVDKRTIQAHGSLHGGASVAFAETLGSVGANLQVNYPDEYCVGAEINANHLTSVNSGWVHGVATPLKIGKRLQVWDIQIKNDHNELVCVSRLTVAIIPKKAL